MTRSNSVGLFDPRQAHSNCGVGALVDLQGRRSHRLVADGLRLLANLDHRGARGAEKNTGDGAGILLQKPHTFFQSCVDDLPEFDGYGVGQFFLPRASERRREVEDSIARIVSREGFRILAWRTVPTDSSGLGKTALATEPAVKQLFVAPQEALDPATLDIRLYLLRCWIEQDAGRRGLTEELFYVCSFDRRKIVYKGQFTSAQLKSYYPDLSDERVQTSLVLVHSRFSTNTLGAWHLAHPYRTVVHNGEFNTLRGNVNWMRARDSILRSERLGDALEQIMPLRTQTGLSDSEAFDRVLEMMLAAGHSLPLALRMLIPEAWSKDAFMAPEQRAFYDYYATLMEPWDGPALVVASDGYRIATVLDRNGLRPCRYCITRDQQLILASETGTLETPAENILSRGRLKPGQLFVADTLEQRIIPEEELWAQLTAQPHTEWLRSHRVRLRNHLEMSEPTEPPAPLALDDIQAYQRLFGYTEEVLSRLVRPMVEDGKDPIGAMGNDSPPAALATQYKPLANYFAQEFAQVSNPPLDYIREDLVTSLESHIGRQGNPLDTHPEACRRLHLDSPILSDREFGALQHLDVNGIRARTIDMTYAPGSELVQAIEQLRAQAVKAIEAGYEILILSDRTAASERIPIPSLLAIGALHHALIRRGLRTSAGLVLEAGEPCTVHQFCTLLGYGADAVYPWLVYRSIDQQIAAGEIEAPSEDAQAHYRAAVDDGILKVMSKMGISVLESYKGAQIFETIGLSEALVEEYFTGTTARVPGIGLTEIEQELLHVHKHAFTAVPAGNAPLDGGGEFFWRRDGEVHKWNPLTISQLQHAVRTNNSASYRSFAAFVNEQRERPFGLVGCLDFKADAARAVPLDEVESAESIVKRFSTGSMSFGALSLEAHEALAIAMNKLGAKSGTGEGGEQVERFGTPRACSMKQVASGRFGVTLQYLAQARQIEIKMAQGSKPGEGGELPGAKVGEGIAKVRFTVPGVGLISPPPHHDIYSIEDLKQLIHDLKCASPEAEIHVKLVAKANVGTIAAGVAKAHADAILISGNSGGTGASKITSIKSAGVPWELGLAETQQALLATELRSRVRLRTDGGLTTGRDVAIAALLGAEEFGFGTAPMVALGCIMLRKCHCNTCSVGVATQDPRLRAKFAGAPEHVINYFYFVAEELRELMAELGFRTVQEMIGRVDQITSGTSGHPRGVKLDLSALLYRPVSPDQPYQTRRQDHELGESLDMRLIEEAEPALRGESSVVLHTSVHNRDRSIGTLLSNQVAKRCGMNALAADTIRVYLRGSAGQSLGAFLAAGVSLHLEGDANDYVGKGLSGGKIIMHTPSNAGYAADANIIIGNVALYGATSGEAYINGLAGERFAVRNSGAMAVVEGIGDHGCEYMTGGVVVVLGSTGKNFAAGMSGGEAYIYDTDGTFEQHVNRERVHTRRLNDMRDIEFVHRLLENHVHYTDSQRAHKILRDWPNELNRFVKVVPDSYAEAIARRLQEQGEDMRPTPPESASARESELA